MATTHAAARLAIKPDQVSGFCRRWKITELAIFGSALRPDFRPDSEVVHELLVLGEAVKRLSPEFTARVPLEPLSAPRPS